MGTSSTAIIPVEQDVVPLAGYKLIGVRLEGNSVAAVLRVFCDALHLNYVGQMQRIKAHPVIASSLLLARIETAGGFQEMNVLLAGAIPTWLAGIQITRVAPELRPTLLAFQREAADALYRHFFSHLIAQQLPPQQPPPKTEPIVDPALYQAILEALSDIRKQLAQEQEIREVRSAGMERKLSTLGDKVATLTALVSRNMVSGPLTAEHQAEVWELARSLHRRTGQPMSAIERELTAPFGVDYIDQLPEAAWAEIAVWFWSRLGW